MAAMQPVIPDRRNYKPTTKSASITDLPFVTRRHSGKGINSNFNPIPTDDYITAVSIGREYAGHYIQYLQDNPGLVGMPVLSGILSDANFDADYGQIGYIVGFLTFIEQFLYATGGHIDVWKCIDAQKSGKKENRE